CRWRAPLVTEPQFVQRLPDDRALVVPIENHKRPIDPDARPVLAEDSAAGVMERAHPDRSAYRCPDQLVHAPPHFLGGLIGEGHRQDAGGGYTPLAQQVGDAVRQNTRLARSRSREDKEWARAMRDGREQGGIDII